MSEYIKLVLDGEDEIVTYNVSDYHVGSLAFHEKAAVALHERILDEKAYLTFGGDAGEAKLIDSPHFNPDGLHKRMLNPQDQADHFIGLMQTLADEDRILLMSPGNHDQYLAPNFNLMKYICDKLGILDRMGSYQSWLNVNGCTMHFWHGRPTLPRGAKDPIQREANQRAWLKNKLEGLAGSAQAQYMAHIHKVLVQPPEEHYTLLDHEENCKGRFFREQPTEIDGKVWIPPSARWYASTGTLRRSGVFGTQDYSEVAGYAPTPMACTKTTQHYNKIHKIEKVLL